MSQSTCNSGLQDFAIELGCLGFTMRIKRLSDALMHDGKRMYKELGLDIEPNWYLIFRLLQKEQKLSVMEIADRIRLSHPSVISLTNKMIKSGYLASMQCPEDQRKRLLSLTEKAYNRLPDFERVWAAGEKGIIKTIEGTAALEALAVMEMRFGEKGFKQRTLDELNFATMNAPATKLTVEILNFESRYAKDFARINYEWLEKHFEVEPHDREMLDHPQSYIIDAGGHVFFAKTADQIVGTCALIAEDEDTYELAKMGVTSEFQGLKIGDRLIRHAIDFSKKAGKKRIVLESNTRLTPAINLYIKSGFKAAPLNACSPYARCNIRMELSL